MKRSFCLLLLAFTCFNTYAQKFTHADTLRGTLSPLRTAFDVTYYELDVAIDTIDRSITGSVLMTYRAVENFSRLQIDLFENLRIDSIMRQGSSLKYTRDGNAVFVDMGSTVTKGATDAIKIYYGGKPQVAKNAPWDGGFTWTHDDKGNAWIAVSCEGLGASVWWPNKDHGSDEPDSMLIKITVPRGLMNVSNGRLRNSTVLGDKIRYDWFVSYPINNYNVTFNIGKYEHFSDVYVHKTGDTLTLDYWVMPYNMEKAKEQFKQVKPMMACYEQYFGPYPFTRDGYKLVETPYLGMEHQSAIAYGNKYKSGYLGRDLSNTGQKWDYIIIHETGHEWWGNNVSMKDAADMWIHEGFCTYGEAVYLECMENEANALKYIIGKRGHIGNKKPVVGPYGVNQEGEDIYDKGMQLLSTMRYVINDDKTWFGILKGIQHEFALKTVTTEDIVTYINRQAGKDLTPIFDQYLRYPNIPVFEYRITGKKKHVNLEYRWKADVASFNMPAKVMLTPDVYTTVLPTTQWQTLPLKLKKGEGLKVDDEHYYIRVEKM